MARVICHRCFWPQALCWCGSIQSMDTRTRFVFLMHPKEFKREKAGTGRLAHLCLTRSEIHMGASFEDHPGVRALIADPQYHPVLLYPGAEAMNLTSGGPAPRLPDGRRLLVLILDGTWSGARKMLRLSPSLQRLPRIMFTPSAPSRFVIKQQPQAGCLATIEAVHEVLIALRQAGLDDYPLPDQLLGLFQRMQDFQIRCAADLARPGYRRRAYSQPGDRNPVRGQRNLHRRRYLPLHPGS